MHSYQFGKLMSNNMLKRMEQQYGIYIFHNYKRNDTRYINNITDSALIAFMKIFAKINRE